jgi:type II secretory pathway pseudopilin PulG
MIVSLAIFSIVAVVALTALMSIMSANRKAQSLQSAITNLSYAMESLSREMRVSTKYHCNSGIGFVMWDRLTDVQECDLSNTTSPGGLVIAFNSPNTAPSTENDTGFCNLIYAYRFIVRDDEEGYDLQKAEQTVCHATLPDSAFSSVIDDKVVITEYHVYVSDPSLRYPYSLLRISGYTGDKEKDKTYFDLQTAISARTP